MRRSLLGELLEGEPLTGRELEVLEAAARGLTAAETAAELYLSFETVKSYRKRCAAKLGARTLAHSVALGLRRGLLRLDNVR